MSNINITTQACSIGPTVGLFYYIDDFNLVSVNSTGSKISYYTKASYTNTIKFITFGCSSTSNFDYSGIPVFTAEVRTYDVIFRRWMLDLDTLSLMEIKSIKYNKVGYYSFDLKGFSLEKYVRTITVSVSVGQNYIHISNTVHIKSGQECIIGPSTIGGSLNNVTFTKVNYIDGNRVYLEDELDNAFAAGNYIVFIGDILVSSSKGISNGDIPTLYILDSKQLLVKDYRTIYQIRTIACSEFANDTLYLCSKYCIYFVNIDTYLVSNILYQYQHCNGNYKDVYDMIVVDVSLFYTLQKDIVSFNNFTCSVETTSYYNLSTNLFQSYINSSQVIFGSYVTSNKINVISKVLDQYARPMYNVVSNFKTSDDNGSFSESKVLTNVSGEACTVYTIGDDIKQILTSYSDSTFAGRSSDYVYGDNYINIAPSKSTTISIGSYSDITCNSLISIYSNAIDCGVAILLFQNNYWAINSITSIMSKNQDILIYSYSDKKSNNKISLNAGHSIHSKGLVWNAESAYTNYELNDSSVVSDFTFMSYFLPKCGSTKNSRSVVIDFTIFPQVYAFDVSTFLFKIREINNIFNYDSGFMDVSDIGKMTIIDIGSGRYAIRFLYSPLSLYKFNSRVYCCLSIYDTAPIKNLIKFNCYFDIIADYIAPTIITVYPACGSVNVPKDIDISAIIDDVGTGINTDSVSLMLDGIPVIPAVYVTSSGVLLTYNSPIDFNSGASVSLSISALDMNNNLMLKSCKFYIIDSNKPIIAPEDICSDIVDNRFNFWFDVFDAGGGVKYNAVKLFLNNKDVEVIVKPVIERIR